MRTCEPLTARAQTTAMRLCPHQPRVPTRPQRLTALLCVVSMLAPVAPVWAAPPSPVVVTQPTAQTVAPKRTAAVTDAPLTTLFDLGADEPAPREIAFDVARSLRRSKQVRYRDLDDVLNVGADDTQVAGMRSGDGFVKSGKAKLQAGQYKLAVDDFDAAVESYAEAYAVLPDATVLPRAMALLAVAELLGGQDEKATAAFARSVQADPKYEQDFTEYPPRVQAIYDTARQAVLARPSVEYEVRTTPPNARVYVNGAFQGLSPVWVKTRLGEQFIAIAKHGYARRVKTLTPATIRDLPPVEEELVPAKRKGAFDTVTERLADIFDGAVEPADLTEAQGLSGVGYAVAVRASGTRDAMHVQLALANLAGRQVVNRVSRDIAWHKRDKELIDKLVDELFHIDELPVYEPPPETVVPGTPVYQTWWFWTVIGAVAAGSTVAVLLATRKSTPSQPKYAPGHGGLLIQF